MYEFIRGRIAVIGTDYAAIDAGGVGYKIYTTQRYLSAAVLHTEETLYTHLAVREDDMSLYGFPTAEERSMFLRLIAISGIGPKAALAILSVMTPSDIASAVMAGDSKAFSRAPGVGAKTATRIIMELKEKIDVSDIVPNITAEGISDKITDAIEALTSLGYQRTDAAAAVNAVKDLADTAEEITVLALKRMNS